MTAITLRAALDDPQLLGSSLVGPSWDVWRAVLLASQGEPLNPAEDALFRSVTGNREPPTTKPAEFWAAIGRRGGKDAALSTLAVYVATLVDHSACLSRGEVGTVLLIAPDQKQSRVTLQYIEGCLKGSPRLASLIESQTAETIRLSNGITIEVRSASFRRIRGITAVFILANEVAFWHSEDSSNPDLEILNAARPMLATTSGQLCCISSPYARRGELWRTYDAHFGPDGDPSILVAQGATEVFNPSIPADFLKREYERDPASASAEYGGLFRSDIAEFVSLAAIRSCITPDCHERPPNRQLSYRSFCDPSGGSSDAFTVAIGHREGADPGTAILDAVREFRPPFSPEAVVAEISELLKSYRISRVTGDRYGGEFPRELFRKCGIFYELSDRSKSDYYRDCLPLLNSQCIDLLDNDRLTYQLASLERRTARGGKDSIDHSPGSHDDLANSVAGVLVQCFEGRSLGAERLDVSSLPQVVRGHAGAKGMAAGTSRGSQSPTRNFTGRHAFSEQGDKNG